MRLYINGALKMDIQSVEQYSGLTRRYYGMQLDVGIDQSKSHTAIVVQSVDDTVREYIEILGEGGATDVFDVCAFTRRAINQIFEGAKFRAIGIEDPIEKNVGFRDKNGNFIKGNQAMSTHENRIKLTAIFSNYMFLFYDLAGFHPTRVNNMDWKGTVLPAEYRTKQHTKGSLDWHRDNHTWLANTNDNVTDAECILQFVRRPYKDAKIFYEVQGKELPLYAYTYAIIDSVDPKQIQYKCYSYNSTYEFKDNLNFVANRLSQGSVAVIQMRVDDLPIDAFYSEEFKAKKYESTTLLVVVRRSNNDGVS